MPQYQKPDRNAKLGAIGRVSAFGGAHSLAPVAGTILILMLTILPAAVQAAPVRQTSQTPATTGRIELPVVTPDPPAGAQLHAHIATIAVDAAAPGAESVTMTAGYDLRNDSKTDLTQPVRIAPIPAGAVSATLDGVPLTLTPTGEQTLSAEVSIPAGEQVTLSLNYQVSLPDAPLGLVQYPLEALAGWASAVSVRVDLLPGPAVPPESWLHSAPAGWEYAPPTVTEDTGLQWLADGELPGDIEFEFVHPIAWGRLQEAQAAAVTLGTIDAQATLGGQYARLAADAAALGRPAVQERFFAQAVAAYSAGLIQGQAAGVAPAALAPLHAALAELYRGRIVGADGAQNGIYAELMAAEAGAALQGMMVDDPRRRELEQWQTDGLRMVLADTRRRGDVAAALALLDRLAQAPAGAGGSDFLAQERQALVVQQALQLLAQGDRPAALALAGDVLNDPALQPPADRRSLFARWSISATVSPANLEVVASAWPAEDRADEARAALTQVVEAWRTGAETRRISARLDGENPLRLELRLPAGTTGVSLAQTLPQRADWVLLRALLNQLGPEIRAETQGFWERLHVRQPIDLRSAGAQWTAMADDLERLAAEIDAQIAQGGSATATLADAQRAAIQAANQRHAAQQWRALARDSQVMLALAAPGGLGNTARAWLVTVQSPPQMLDVEVNALNRGRVALATAVGIGLLLMAAGVLWRLL